jgi:23S rRNA (guanosine2251-2'-O)-methyltransferase
MATIVYGKQPVLEALKSKTPIEKLFVLHGMRTEPLKSILHLAKQKGIPVTEVNAQRLRDLGADEHSQGVVALITEKEYVEFEDLLGIAHTKNEHPFFLILDEIVDPHNLGALIRTAECSGVHGVIIPKHHSVSINETVAKTSAGASLHLPVARVTNIVQTMETLKSHGVWIVGLDMNGDKVYDDVDYTGPVAIVIGNEGKGIRRLVKENCDFLIRIPMYGKIESLNASVSGALVMYEAARGRHVGRKRLTTEGKK